MCLDVHGIHGMGFRLNSKVWGLVQVFRAQVGRSVTFQDPTVLAGASARPAKPARHGIGGRVRSGGGI